MKNWVGLAFWFATRWPDLSATAAAETTKAAATAAVTENGFRYDKLRNSQSEEMLSKLVVSKCNHLTANVTKLATRPLISAFSSAGEGSSNGGSKEPPKIDLWQKIKTGMINPRRLDKKANDRNVAHNNARGNNRSKPEGEVKGDNNRQHNRAEKPASDTKGVEGSARQSPNRSAGPRTPRTPHQSQNTNAGQNRRPPRQSGPARGPAGGPAGANQKKPVRKFTNNSNSPKKSSFGGKPKLQAWRQASVRSEGGDGGPEPFARGGRRTRTRDDDDDFASDQTDIFGANREEDIPEADKALLFDDDFFVEKVKREGGSWAVYDEEADFFDDMLSRAYLGSIHTSDNSFQELLRSPGFGSHFHLPKARNMHQLRCALVPKIDADPESLGYKHATEAWTVLQRNYYYSDRQKRKIVTDIAKTVNHLMVIAEEAKNKPPPVIPPPIVEEEKKETKSKAGKKRK